MNRYYALSVEEFVTRQRAIEDPRQISLNDRR
jgi:hypothetical protein